MFDFTLNDESATAILIIIWMLGTTATGFAFGDYTGALTGCLFGLVCLPGILFFIAITFLKGHEDIYG
jgi:hypothetical protein